MFRKTVLYTSKMVVRFESIHQCAAHHVNVVAAVLAHLDFAVLRCQVPCLQLSLSSQERPNVLRGLYSVKIFWIWNNDSSFSYRHYRNWML